jgi:hypothetical protein
MPKKHSLDDPQHWRERAEGARTIADHMSDALARETMLRVAADCDLLAERTAQKLAKRLGF